MAKYTGTSPAVIAHRMGLADSKGSAIPAGSLLTLTSQQLTESAYVARLSKAEMEGLLLASLGRRYGPLNQQYASWSDSQQLTYQRSWVYLRKTQFCTRCLTEDDSLHGVMLGGRWKKRWHLPVVFACVEHRQLLKRNCPGCQHPAHAARAGILEHAATEELHPTQCRASRDWRTSSKSDAICGTYLSDGAYNPVISSDRRTRNELLALQRRIDCRLSDYGPDEITSCGELVPVAQHFMDMRAVTALIFISWPQARPLAITETLARAVGGEAKRRRLLVWDQRKRVKHGPIGDFFHEPPSRPLAVGAVLGIAERLLSADDGSGDPSALTEIYQRSAEIHPGVSARIAKAPGISPGLRRSFGPMSPRAAVDLHHRPPQKAGVPK
ncbi:TniQ family protein [Streptomyces sp. NBC_01754]|uniref:TniQ family protein n=1 Tax=Streptomyces sp. NBC_01754 TaxID=2975930 RepID=UPI003FA3495E